MAPLDRLAWTKLDAQRAFVSWFRGDTVPTIEQALVALDVAWDACHPDEFPGEESPRGRASCLTADEGGGMCLSVCLADDEYARASVQRWAIGIGLAWAMGAPLEGMGFSHGDRDLCDPLWEAFDALAELLLVPEDVVGDLSHREAHKAFTTVSRLMVDAALESRVLGMKRHEAALLAFAMELEAAKVADAA